MVVIKRIILLVAAAATTVNGQAKITIDKFASQDSNALGSWHGCDEGDGITCTWGSSRLTIRSTDTDYSFYTQFKNDGCQNIQGDNLLNHYVHISFSGSSDFTIALQENNPSCDWEKAPYPQTWDTVYAADYARGGQIYVPISHFNINKQKVLGLAFKGFRSTSSTTFTLVELTSTVPSSFGQVPQKKATGILSFACTRPNSIAFGIDDGVPELAQQMMQIIKDAGIKVTFFTVGNALYDNSANFTAIYKEMISLGHQVALHSYTHPKIESLSVSQIDSEYTRSINALRDKLGVQNPKYFRAPYGTDGALTRQRLEVAVGGNSKVINWSVDIEDWLYGEDGDPQRKQTEAVKRDLAKGGNLFVAHYLYPSTVQQFPEWIRLAKATGKQIMRVDQCLQDPSAPPL